MKEETKYNKVVNIAEDGEISVLQTTFKYPDGFKGATGSHFYPVSEREYKARTTLTAMEETLRGAVREEDIPAEFIGHEKGTYKNPYRMWAKAIKDAGESEQLMFDNSYCDLWDYLREACGHSDKEAYIYECTGGGRMFSADYQGNVNPELSEVIREFESK